jgi:hypothetical protein
MCDKCKPFDDKMAHYGILSKNITDQQTMDGIEQLIQKLEMQKSELQPEK